MMNYSESFEVTTPGDREIVLKRRFAAPRERVWDAMTKPECLKRWLLGPPGWTMAVCENDVRPGGAFRWAWSGPDGAEIAMLGVNREVEAPERIVRTERFDVGCEPQSGEQLGTMVLTENGAGVTQLTLTILYPSKEARDASVASGMASGPAAGYNLLDGFFASGQI
jgi:uncharacterized protein YndB with AHSA1/START domain